MARILRYTGAVPLLESIDLEKSFQVEEVRIHTSAGGAGIFTVSIDSAAGAAYDIVLVTQDMAAVTDFVYQPTRPLQFSAGDEIDLTWANGDARTYGVELVFNTGA